MAIAGSIGKSDIIIGGQPLALGVHDEVPPIVLTWHDHGISFAPGQGFNKKRKKKIDLAVWHWTGGEGEPPQVAETLKTRGYGVEFAIARTGVIYQFVDPLEVDTADAGGVNARSVGTEIVSYGFKRPDVAIPRGGMNRLQRERRIHGERVTVADFYPAQLTAARALADGLSRGLGIPRRVPMSAEGAVLARQIPTTDLARFTGHVGHYHLTHEKYDPGPDLLGELGELFAATGVHNT